MEYTYLSPHFSPRGSIKLVLVVWPLKVFLSVKVDKSMAYGGNKLNRISQSGTMG